MFECGFQVFLCTCLHTYIHTCPHYGFQVFMSPFHKCTDIFKCDYTYIYTHIHTYINYTHTYIHTYIFIVRFPSIHFVTLYIIHIHTYIHFHSTVSKHSFRHFIHYTYTYIHTFSQYGFQVFISSLQTPGVIPYTILRLRFKHRRYVEMESLGMYSTCKNIIEVRFNGFNGRL